MTTADPAPQPAPPPAVVPDARPALGALVRRNPVALKELRGRMRGPRAFVVLTAYVALMSLFAVTLYLIYTASSTLTLSTTGGVIGKLIFGGVLAVELFLVCFISPSFTAGAISGERERQTFNLLRTTLLPARRIVFGKLLSSLAYVVLLMMVAIPLQSLAFLMGGITAEEVGLSLLILLVTALLYAAVGLYFSAVTRRTLTASLLTYSFALVFTVALPLVVLVLFGLLASADLPPLPEAVFTYLVQALSALSPVSTTVQSEVVLQQYGLRLAHSATLSNGARLLIPAPWLAFSAVYLVLSIALVGLTVRAIRHTQASD